MVCECCGCETYVIYVDKDKCKLCPECHDCKEDKSKDENSGTCEA